MNSIFRKTMILLSVSSAVLLNQSCIDEVQPTSYASDSQIEQSQNAQEALLSGLVSFMVAYDTYGSSGGANDWGYPCQMVMRDVMTEDFPVTFKGANYDYFTVYEEGTTLRYNNEGYFYYAQLIKNACNLIKACDTEGASYASKVYAGIGYAYRALAYFDMARMYEFKPTGYSNLDSLATEVWGLTVPIVTEKTGLEESKHNPRAPFYTMYRFILSDLNKAEEYLSGYNSAKETPDEYAIKALKARFWLELATRFEKSSDDLATQLSHENDEDGYAALGISSATDCYNKALRYAQDVIGGGFTPVTREQWYDTSTGFNTATNAWIWLAKIGTKEQLSGYYYYSWMGTLNNEGQYTLGYYGTYRCISKALFDKIPDNDWRKASWVDPNDVGKDTVPSKYSTLIADSRWASIPAYAGLKFHTGGGSLDDYYTSHLCDIPLIRVEEMYFIAAEAKAHTQGVAAGNAELENFVNTYRYTTDASGKAKPYTCAASDISSFTDSLMVQKRIELWGEGLVYFDYKRLGLAITRAYPGTNFYKNTRLNSKSGYVAPWLNYYLSEYENSYNPSAILNPDPSGVVKDETTY